MMKLLAFVMSIVVFLASLAHAQLFSPFNRFSLSSVYSDSLRSKVMDGRCCFFSLPADWNDSLPATGISLENGDQRFEARLCGVASGGMAGGRTYGFGAVNGLFSLSSRHLDGLVDLNWYSTDRIDEAFPVEVAYERMIIGSEVPIDGMFDFRFGLREGYITLKGAGIAAAIGKKKLRWGPGYKGTLGLSGVASAPFYYYHIRYGFKELVKASAFLCGYDDEARFRSEIKYKDTLFVAATGQNISSLPPRYGAGQRLDVRVGQHVQIGLYELVNFFGTNELNRFANPLAFYYAANTTSGTNNANMLGGADVNVVVLPWRWYAEFLNDDITVFEQAGNPDKYAWQAGAQYFPARWITHAGVEYTHLSRYLYGHSRVLNRHTHWDESLGWPWGNYQDMVSAHAVFNEYRNVRIKTEITFWLWGRGTLADEWYADGRPDLDHAPYWPELGARMVSGVLALTYRPRVWCTLELCCSPLWRGRDFDGRVYGFFSTSIPRLRAEGSRTLVGAGRCAGVGIDL